jgi:hypothetical protein
VTLCSIKVGDILIIDKKKFRYTAVIDFVEITFHTKDASNAFSIKRNLGFDYVHPMDKRAGAAANEFKAKIQNVKHWSEIDRIYKRLNDQYELSSEPKITCIEVSFDAYSKGASFKEMIEHVANYYWMLANPVSQNRRFTRGTKGTTQSLSRRAYMLNRLSRGGTVYIGDHRYDPEGMRIYYKQTDKEEDLPMDEHRSRIEITLRDASCPFDNLEDAIHYDFANLSNYFKFRQPKAEMSPFEVVIADATPLLGEKKERKRRGRGKYMYSSLTDADVVLNSIVYDQLRYLTKRLKSSREKKIR